MADCKTRASVYRDDPKERLVDTMQLWNSTKGGHLAANFRSANIAEGLAIQMLRTFTAVAPVAREEDYGIDLVATLLRRAGKVYVAEESFFVQIKTASSANFTIAGDGIQWLRQLALPYFPVVVDLSSAALSLFTINNHRTAIDIYSRVSKLVFTTCGDGLDDFPLGEPLLTWSLEEATHPEFPTWARSVLKPAIQVEAWNQHYSPSRSIRFLDFETQAFSNRRSDGTANHPPVAGELLTIHPGDREFICNSVVSILEPFAGWLANTGMHDHLGGELLKIRDAFRPLGLDPDSENTWDEIVSHMAAHGDTPPDQRP